MTTATPPQHAPTPAMAVSPRGQFARMRTQCRCGRMLLLCVTPNQPDYLYWRHMPARRQTSAPSAPIPFENSEES